MTPLSETDGGQNRGATALPSGSRPSDQALLHGPDASRFDPSRFDPSRLVGLLRALAHDCENTDGWEDAAPTAHEAADCLLTIATRITALSEWVTTNHVVEEPDTDYESGWDNGYGAARRFVAAHLRIASGIETEGHDRAAGRGAEHESATAESGDAQDIGGPSQ